MQKRFLLAVVLFSTLQILNTSCSKDDDPSPAGKTRTELLAKSSWKFSDAKVGGTSVSAFLQACQKDNIATFATAGTGTADEGPTKCDASDPQTTPFTWNFQTNETILFISTPLFTGGSSSFTIVSLTETELVVSQNMTIAGSTQNVVITFIH
ncbi:lipocalin family protein [Terrimonas alba]|uniref:lipocalin family protein n=1 Tax=Terrimonas alba TaxID=3349636 RepID=UPI0035F231C7